MFAILLFSLLVLSGAQTTTIWTGASLTGSPSWGDVNNWSNGIPTATSIVQISDTTCNTTSNCYPTVDVNAVVAELNVGAVTFDIYLTIVANLTVTSKAVFGTKAATSAYSIVYVYFNNGNLTTTSSCNTTIYYTTENFIYAEDTYTGLWWNYGDVWVYSNGGLTGVYEIQIGDGVGELSIVNWGNWIVTDPKVYLAFYYLSSFQHWSGSYNATWTSETTPQSTIQWDTSNLWILGAFTSSGPLYFYSAYSNSESSYSSTPASVVNFGVAGIIIENALFSGVNIVFDFSGTLYDCNITSYAFINSTSSTTATISGNSYFLDETFLSCFTTGVTFQVVIDQPSTLTMNGYFGILGNVVLVNSGTFIFDSDGDLYFDSAAFWVNMGLMNVITYSNDYIIASTFPGAGTGVGTMINMGTIQFENGGGLDFEQGKGNFYQTATGVMLFIYTTTGTPGSVTFADIALDGYVGVYFGAGYTLSGSYDLFTWNIADYTSAPGTMWTGNLNLAVKDDSETIATIQQTCYDASTGTVSLNPVHDGICSPNDLSVLSPTGGVATLITTPPAAVTSLLAQVPPCGAGTANTNCGQSVGISGPPAPGHSSGSIIPLSISFLVSCVAYLYFSTF